MGDLPDWNRPVQISGLRYLGSFDVTIGGGGSGSGQLNFDLQTLDRAIIVFQPLLSASVEATVGIGQQAPGTLVTRSASLDDKPQMVVGYASPAIGTAWEADATLVGPAGGPYTYQVFADSELPLTAVEPGDVPLVVDATVSGVIGPQQSAASLPVVVASDQAPVFSRPPASFYGHASPGVGVQGTLTFPAVPGRRYRLAYLCASFTATAGAATANQALYIRDGASGVGAIIWAIVMSSVGTVGDERVVTIVDLPIFGTTGNGFTVEFGAGAPAYFEWLSVGVYT